MALLQFNAANGSGFTAETPTGFLVKMMMNMPTGPVIIERTADALIFSELVCIDMDAAAAPLGAAALSFGG
jgi:hypothetical protein